MTAQVSATGDPVLDQMLGGGFPTRRATLVTGDAGTGKTTLGMQFLQAGLDDGDDCLFISTEQTLNELRESFQQFNFALDHENLTFASVHAAPGRTLEGDEELVLQTLGADGEPTSMGFDAPFTGEYIQQHLQQFGPADRVVFDSISGLAAITDDEERYRRTIIDLIRFFTDQFEATTVFTAEARTPGEGSMTEVLRFVTHGVLELTRQTVAEDTHRFVEVRKLRGVDHDRRTFEVEVTADGLRAGPARRSQPPALKDHRHQPIGIEGLDNLAGGGLVQGTGVLIEQDGRVNLSALFAQLLHFAIESDYAITLVPTVSLRESRVQQLLDGYGLDVETLLAEDRLFVVDLVGTWNRECENVLTPDHTAEAVTDALAEVQTRTDRSMFSLVGTDGLVHTLGVEGSRTVRYAQEAHLVDDEEMLIHVVNPDVVSDAVGAFYVDAAEQVLSTWIRDDGLQYVTLQKSPCGFVGSTSLVEYIDEPPYLRVQNPPQTRENPYVCD